MEEALHGASGHSGGRGIETGQLWPAGFLPWLWWCEPGVGRRWVCRVRSVLGFRGGLLTQPPTPRVHGRNTVMCWVNTPMPPVFLCDVAIFGCLLRVEIRAGSSPGTVLVGARGQEWVWGPPTTSRSSLPSSAAWSWLGTGAGVTVWDLEGIGGSGVLAHRRGLTHHPVRLECGPHGSGG